MRQYYQIRPQPGKHYPSFYWGTYGELLEDRVNADTRTVCLKIADRWCVDVPLDILVPVFEPGLIQQLDTLFGYDKRDDGEGEPASPKPSPQPLNESADAPVEPSLYDDLTKQQDALQVRLKDLEHQVAKLFGRMAEQERRPWVAPDTFTYPKIWTAGGVTLDTSKTNFTVLNTNVRTEQPQKDR